MLQDGNPARQPAIDIVRGAVMALMAVDHVRDFFHDSGVNPRDVGDPALFGVRWVTRFCAPTFMLLAGVAAHLFGARRTRGELARFLATRGAWLLLLELTVVRVGWTFDLVPGAVNLGVIWAIGWSMIALAALVFLPRAAIAAIAAVMNFGHNLLDGIRAADLGAAGWAWKVLHERGVASVGEVKVFVSYPLIPWIGVLAAGYVTGPLLARPPAARTRALVVAGAAAIALFVALRAAGLGDPTPRVAYADPVASLLSFLDCEKYPPSLAYLGMTLGPALLALAVADRARGRTPRIAAWLATLGRVPMFYVVAHLYLIHARAVLFAAVTVGDVAWLFRLLPTCNKPPGFGLPLAAVLAVSAGVVAMLTPLCAWFAAVKRRRKEWWLSYL